MLLHSRFDPQDIEKERQVIIEEINRSKDSPAQRVDMLIDGLLWPEHPLGRDIAGSRESVAAITREMILSYQQSGYLPANTVVTVAGNILIHGHKQIEDGHTKMYAFPGTVEEVNLAETFNDMFAYFNIQHHGYIAGFKKLNDCLLWLDKNA